jgi:tetratricopeptide (TPR) repeat protein
LSKENSRLSSTVILSRAEKHLLAAYREEVAHLLEQAGLEAILRMPSSRALVYRSRPEPAEKRIRSSEWWGKKLAALRTFPVSSEAQQALALFDGAGRVPPSRWIGLSLKLVPNDRRRIGLGISLSCEGDQAGCAAILEGILSHAPDANTRSYCLQSLAWTLFDSSRFAESAEHYRRAFELCPQRLSPLVAWLHAALCTEDQFVVETAANAASEVRGNELEMIIDDHARLWSSRIESGGFQPSAGLQHFVSAVRGDLPDQVRRISDVFTPR